MARRKGAEDSATRLAIIERAISVIESEGCAAVTARRITSDLQLSRYSVHYYFGTIDELFVAIMRHESEKAKNWYAEVLASDNPLRLIWEHPATSDPKIFEFSVLARRSETIAAEIKRSIDELNRIFVTAIERHLEMRGITPTVPPIAIVTITLSVSRALGESSTFGVEAGHRETRAIVEEWIETFERTGAWPSVKSPPLLSR